MRRLLAFTLTGLLCVTGSAPAAPHTTADRTIQDCDGDQLLDPAPGERHGRDGDTSEPGACARVEGDQPLRLPQTASLLNFLQLTDFQMIDEESPGRVEFLDGTQRNPFSNPFSAAYRPQDSLTTQITESSVRQARDTTSPVTGARLDFTLLTGDNADSQQFNETRWFVDILDGTTGSGNPDPEMENPPDRDADRKLDPDSGIPVPGCEGTPGSIYDGVRDSGRTNAFDVGYYEPDSSTEPDEDGDGYSPIRAENIQETGRDVRVRDFPGLFERANERFEAVGLGMPWYSAFGNHDALIQGNSPEAYFGPGGATNPSPLGPATELFNPLFQGVAMSCVKVKQPTPAQREEIVELTEQIDQGGLSLEQLAAKQAAIQRVANEALTQAQEDPAGFVAAGGEIDVVPPDPRRCYLAKDDPSVPPPGSPCATGGWIAQHFRTTGTPVGHGFAPQLAEDCAKLAPREEQACRGAAAEQQQGPGVNVGRPPQAVANHDGYYSFVPKRGFRFVALDTITDECGGEFCAEGSIDDAQFQWLRGQLQTAQIQGEQVIAFGHHTLRTIRQPNADPSEAATVHYGQRVDRERGQPQQAASPQETLEELFCQSRAFIGYVSGHEHENFVERHGCQADVPPTPGSGRFYEISTSAHLDYPQQARMIEIVRLPDGRSAFVLTVLDHAAPPKPGEATGNEVLRLASIGRELAYNDYQGNRGARGDRADRNVVLPFEP